jgi:hypothetical protein
MVTRRIPFEDVDDETVSRNIAEGLRPELKDFNYGEDIINLIEVVHFFYSFFFKKNRVVGLKIQWSDQQLRKL